jgi:plastocyanin
MNAFRGLISRPVKMAMAFLMLVLIIGPLSGCVPSNAQQTLTTPATPITNIADISPDRRKEPSASPKSPSIPSVSPSANAVIPSPGQTTVPIEVPIPSPPPSPSPSASPQSVTLDLTAQNLQFDKKSITVTAGDDVTINFNNQDSGEQNNFALYQDKTAKDSIFVGDTITGPAQTSYNFTAPDQPGTYYFQSDNHPEMNGDFIVQ